jgi:hypothetical protein
VNGERDSGNPLVHHIVEVADHPLDIFVAGQRLGMRRVERP